MRKIIHARSKSASPHMLRGHEPSVFEGPVGMDGHRACFCASALVFIISVAVTIYLCWSMSAGMAMPGGWTMSMAWMKMEGQSWIAASASFMGMWVVMMVAMMLPALAPALLRYRLSLRGPQTIRVNALTGLAGAGYFFVWTLVGAAAYPFGVVVAKAGMAYAGLVRFMPIAAGIVLLLAGCLQLTPWKARQLCRCQADPASGRALNQDARGAWRHGTRLGADCALCCSGLMAILLVTGVMNLWTMALVTLAITAERIFPQPERVARAAGFVIIVTALFMIGRALVSL